MSSRKGLPKVDAQALAAELKKRVEGEVRFDAGSRGLYATDSSNFREAPIGVVVPKTQDDIVETHRACSRYGAPILNRGGGTSLSGETVNFAVVIDNSKYLNRIGEVDAARRLVTVEPGAINEKVNIETGKQNLVFGPDPSSHGYCTIGGNLGNNSCGIHSVQAQLYGPGPRTSDNVHAMDIVTYRGERFRVGVGEEKDLPRIIKEGGAKGRIYGQLLALRDAYAGEIRRVYPPVEKLPRRVSGYNLDELLPERGFNVARALVGTEGTCATSLQATLMLTPALLKRATVVIQYADLPEGAERNEEILAWKPIGLEALDQELIDDEEMEQKNREILQKLPGSRKGAWFLVEFGADSEEELRERVERFRSWLRRDQGIPEDRVAVFGLGESSEMEKLIWKVREAGLGATAFPPDGMDHWPGWEDSAVPPGKVAPYVRELKKLYQKHQYRGAIYGHLGQGCIHSRISFDLRTPGGLRRYRSFLDEAADLVVSFGGSLSGEHGDGQQRGEFLVKQYGPKLVQAMREFKAVWDPDGKMNPGKVVDPYPVDAYLKLGADYRPIPVETKFAYPEDGGSFAHATLRCVGAGKCRKPDGVDVMCPSYIVTKEEKHTTRGRARLLFEMMQGQIIKDGWQSREVKDALELCLACKGCTDECPVHVDMPTYKSEFLYHHYQSLRRWRPRYAYAFGFIDRFARLGSLLPGVVNFFTRTPGLSSVAKFAAGVDQKRQVPAFAPLTLQSWFRRRGGSRNKAGRKVILWPDTFNNHFHTQVGAACVEELEAAGFQVVMPEVHVCCGRPLYDYGFLDEAERYLRRTLDVLREDIRAGVPLVGMEPSCLAVFKDELLKILPHDEDARRLKENCFHWPEFFEKHDVPLPKLEGKAVVWGHCHHKATGGMKPELSLLKDRLGLDAEEATGGCCGLAGSFGFETGKYPISMRCAEIGLLPAARKAEDSTLIVADGFSCKTQLEQSGVGRRALHSAEVMRLARTLSAPRLRAGLPENLAGERPPAPPSLRLLRGAAAASLAGLAGWAAYRALSGRRPRTRRARRSQSAGLPGLGRTKPGRSSRKSLGEGVKTRGTT